MEGLSWAFRYRTYPSKRAIQFKPHHDKTNHFSIIWAKSKGDISQADFEAMDRQLRDYLIRCGGIVQFRIIKACLNCTYGRFDDALEQLVLGFRTTYSGIYTIKDLPLDDPKHQHLKTDGELWDEAHPIIFHIHSKSDDASFSAMMRGARNSVVTLRIDLASLEE